MIGARARNLDQRYYGVVEAIVSDVNDPENQGRVKLSYPWFDDETISEWARVRQLYAGNDYGTFFIPEVGDEVLVAFVHGDMRLPIVLGGLYNGIDLPPSHRADDLDQKMIRTKGRHEILLDDTDGQKMVRVTTAGGHEVLLDDDGQKLSATTSGGHSVTLDDSGQNVTIQSSGSHQVVLDDSAQNVTIQTSGSHQVVLDDSAQSVTIQTSGGQSITLSATGTITISAATIVLDASANVALGSAAATEPLVLGLKFLSLFNTHIHTSTLPGVPTSPPLTPLTPAQLSTKVFSQ